MSTRLLLSSLALLVGFNIANIASSREGSTEQKLDPQQLVIGDWYEVSTRWQGTEMPLEGALVKLTDKWMVLGVVQCESSAVPTVPMLQEALDLLGGVRVTDLPYVGAMLSKRTRHYSKSYYWIPRHLANITSRAAITNADVKLDFQGDSPTLRKLNDVACDDPSCRANSSIVWTVDGKASQIDCESVTVTGERVSVVVKSEGEQNVERVVEFNTVSYIWQQVPYDYREARRNGQGQTSN